MKIESDYELKIKENGQIVLPNEEEEMNLDEVSEAVWNHFRQQLDTGYEARMVVVAAVTSKMAETIEGISEKMNEYTKFLTSMNDIIESGEGNDQ